MGLIKEGDDYIVLTDIAGVEDHLGDMDFKVAGTERGITALQMDIKITGVTFEILRDALAQAKEARTFILGKMAEVDRRRRARSSSEYAPRISTIQIDPEKIGLLIGKGGETIRGLQEEFEAQIDVNDEGQVLVYAQNGEQGDALVDRIRSMTKEVEVGDEFAGKVVKTTTFGAFVELAKGTDGLLHISNIAPGQRPDDGRGGPQQGRRDPRPRGRGRPRARPHRPAPRRRPGRRGQVGRGARDGRPAAAAAAARGGDRGGRGRDRGRAAAAAASAATAPRPRRRRRPPRGRPRSRPRRSSPPMPDHRLTELDSGLRVVTERMHSVRSAALGFWIGTGSRGEADDGGRPLAPARAHAVPRARTRYGSLEIDQLFDAMGAELNAGTGKETTSVYARRARRSTCRRAFDVMADMVWRPAFRDVDPEREVVLEEIAMYEDDPQDTVFDVLGEAVFGAHPLGPRDHRPRARSSRDTPVDAIAAFHARALRARRSVVIAAAGSVDHDALVELAERTLGGLRAGDARARAPGAAPPDAAARACASSARTPSRYHVCLGGPGIPRDDERRFALRVLDAIFGGLSSSRLFQEVREERGLAYAVYSFAGQYADTGQVGLYVGTRPDNLAEAMRGRRRRARAPARRAGHRGGARPRAENVKARVVLVARVLERAHEPARRARRSFGLPLLDARRADRAHRRRHARRPARAGRRAVGARAAVGRGDRPRRGRLPRAPSRRSCPGARAAGAA